MKFIIHWLDGKTETIEGTTIADAFTHAGYGAGALKAVDYYEPEDEDLELTFENEPEPKSDLDLAKEALELAEGIIDYCGGGDAWERECNAPAMSRFYEIYHRFFPKQPEPQPLGHEPHHCYCRICDRHFSFLNSLTDHVWNSSTHADRVRKLNPDEYDRLPAELKRIPAIRCELCNKGFQSENAHQTHLSGRRHAQTLARKMAYSFSDDGLKLVRNTLQEGYNKNELHSPKVTMDDWFWIVAEECNRRGFKYKVPKEQPA